jgi:hypothetical protein
MFRGTPYLTVLLVGIRVLCVPEKSPVRKHRAETRAAGMDASFYMLPYCSFITPGLQLYRAFPGFCGAICVGRLQVIV